MKSRRAGATAVLSVSLTPQAAKVLKSAAKRRHAGNVSALIEELAQGLSRQEAFERAWKWYGGPELTDDDRRELDLELTGKKAPRRRKSAA